MASEETQRRVQAAATSLMNTALDAFSPGTAFGAALMVACRIAAWCGLGRQQVLDAAAEQYDIAAQLKEQMGPPSGMN